MKKTKVLLAVTILTASMSITALAGEWKQDSIGYWYQNNDGSYTVNGWQWIDGNDDGISESYYFDANGYLLVNSTTPDGYTVDENGKWIVDGIVQTQISTALSVPKTTATTSASGESSSSWSGNYPYVDGMVTSQPTSGSFWTVNISTGKYHGTSSVDGLLPENTRYYSGDASILESKGYSRCKKNGCR